MAGYEILLLEDGSKIFQKLTWVLEHAGLQVTLEPEGLANDLADLTIASYDLIVARVTFPFNELHYLFKRFKRLNPNGAAILLSKDYDYIFPPEAFQSEIDDYIIMPSNVWEIWHRLKLCLDGVRLEYLKAFSHKAISEINMRAFKLLRNSPQLMLTFLAEVKIRLHPIESSKAAVC